VLVAHACNPSYSGGRDQKDQGLNPAWKNSSQDPISKRKRKKSIMKKRTGGVAQALGCGFKPQYCKKYFIISCLTYTILT
jgi:hypothetical protein